MIREKEREGKTIHMHTEDIMCVVAEDTHTSQWPTCNHAQLWMKKEAVSPDWLSETDCNFATAPH